MSALLAALVPLLFQAADAPRPAIEGYATTLSVPQGTPVGLAVSTASKAFSVQVVRLGAKDDPVWSKDGIAGKEHPIPADASSRGCRWPVAVEVPVGSGWKSGYYEARLTPTDPPGLSSKAYFVVRPASPARDSKILLQLATNTSPNSGYKTKSILLVLATNTYNAYNNWGGYSLYAYNARDKVQGRRVSFERPGGSQFATWEAPFLAWAERNGFAIDVAANSDLEFHPEALNGYKLVLSVGHDEYWSAPMRDTLEAFIGRGGNVAFLSGNSVCWQVRTEDGGRALACWKQTFGDDPVYRSADRRTLTTLWSHHLVGRPENSLTGVGFLWGGYHKSHGQFMDGPGAYNVHRPDHWLFAGTELKAGQPFGGKHTVVGYECDGCELTWKDGLPEPTHRDGTPDTFVILATAPAKWHPDDSAWYERWETGRIGNAVMGVYTRGGTVVTVGSTDWAHGLRGGDPVVERITRNILDKLSH
jgi:hypothetical protein